MEPKAALRLFVDDLQDDAAGVLLRYHALRHEDVMCPLARVDNVAVAEPEPEMKSPPGGHGSCPRIGELERDIA